MELFKLMSHPILLRWYLLIVKLMKDDDLIQDIQVNYLDIL